MFQYFSNRISLVARFAMILVKQMFVSACKPAVPSGGDACARQWTLLLYTTKYYVLRTTSKVCTGNSYKCLRRRPTNIHVAVLHENFCCQQSFSEIHIFLLADLYFKNQEQPRWCDQRTATWWRSRTMLEIDWTDWSRQKSRNVQVLDLEERKELSSRTSMSSA